MDGNFSLRIESQSVSLPLPSVGWSLFIFTILVSFLFSLLTLLGSFVTYESYRYRQINYVLATAGPIFSILMMASPILTLVESVNNMALGNIPIPMFCGFAVSCLVGVVYGIRIDLPAITVTSILGLVVECASLIVSVAVFVYVARKGSETKYIPKYIWFMVDKTRKMNSSLLTTLSICLLMFLLLAGLMGLLQLLPLNSVVAPLYVIACLIPYLVNIPGIPDAVRIHRLSQMPVSEPDVDARDKNKTRDLGTISSRSSKSSPGTYSFWNAKLKPSINLVMQSPQSGPAAPMNHHRETRDTEEYTESGDSSTEVDRETTRRPMSPMDYRVYSAMLVNNTIWYYLGLVSWNAALIGACGLNCLCIIGHMIIFAAPRLVIYRKEGSRAVGVRRINPSELVCQWGRKSDKIKCLVDFAAPPSFFLRNGSVYAEKMSAPVASPLGFPSAVASPTELQLLSYFASSTGPYVEAVSVLSSVNGHGGATFNQVT